MSERRPKQPSTKHRFAQAVGRVAPRRDVWIRNLAFELLCNAFPTGAIVLDARCEVIFSNREADELLLRWNGTRTGHPPTRAIHRISQMAPEIIHACDSLRHGAGEVGAPRIRPKFGGRIFVRHPREPDLSAVVALERSPRDRRVAVFCVFVQDRLRDNFVAGRRDQLAMLTLAERRVAKLVADGLRNREIAEALGKSVTTVKSQLGAIFAKLQIASRTQLAALLRSV